jgi:hypothetical protein
LSAAELFEDSNIEKLKCFYKQHKSGYVSIAYKLEDMIDCLVIDYVESQIRVFVVKGADFLVDSVVEKKY